VRKVVTNLPLVAIGGISRENAGEVMDAGADILAVVSALLSKPAHIRERTQHWLRSFAT
jgi:thiamine monophosphate synthase